MQNALREFKGRVAIGKADLIYNKRVLYQNKVSLILTFTHRLGYLANNCKMVYWDFLCDDCTFLKAKR